MCQSYEATKKIILQFLSLFLQSIDFQKLDIIKSIGLGMILEVIDVFGRNFTGSIVKGYTEFYCVQR